MEHKTDVLILGAGPAGLQAALDSVRAGRTVTVLEARERTGGRIHTVRASDGSPLELGAEFIHGDLPLTLNLLQEAGLTHSPAGGRSVRIQGGADEEDRPGEDWDGLLRRMKTVKTDQTLQAFLEEHFAGPEHAALVARAVAYAEGYDTADASRASVKALHAEWSHQDEDQYRIDAGYGALIAYLTEQVERGGGRILLSHAVEAVQLSATGVTVTAAGNHFKAPVAVMALPLGVLQGEDAPLLLPPSQGYGDALQALGFGDVIKIVLHFSTPFWEAVHPELGFLFSGAPVPTWWTQAPSHRPVLTGWLAGRAAAVQAGQSEEDLLQDALKSLAQLFSQDAGALGDALLDHHVARWSADPHTQGAYAYGTVGGDAARAVLARPLGGRLYFAGEYMHPDGPVTGTVEAALWSGREAAQKLLGATEAG